MEMHMKQFVLAIIGCLIITYTSYGQGSDAQIILQSFYELQQGGNSVHPGHILIHTNALNIHVSSDFPVLRQFRVNENDYDVSFTPGVQTIVLAADDLHSLTLSALSLDSLSSYEMAVSTLPARAGGVPDSLYTVTIQTNFDSCLVSVDGGVAYLSSDSIITCSLSRGLHSFIMRKTGSADIERSADINRDTTLNFPFRPRPSSIVQIEPASAMLEITSQVQKADVIVDGIILGKTPLRVKLRKGRHVVVVTAALAYPVRQEVELQDNEVTKLDVPLQTFASFLKIQCGGNNFKVYLNDSLYTAAATGVLAVYPGTYTLRVEASGYAPAQIRLPLVSKQTTEIAFRLRKSISGLVVRAAGVSGATVYLDNKMVGTTPFSSFEIMPGTYTLKIAKEGIADITQTITITKRDTLVKEFFPGTNFAQLIVLADSSEIFINGEHKGVGEYREKLSAGSYQIAVSRGENYFGTSEKVTLREGDVKTVRLKPTLVLEELNVQSSPSDLFGVQFFLDGVYKGETPLIVYANLGKHTITLKKEGYIDATKVISISRMDKPKITLSMKSLEDEKAFRERLKTIQNYGLIASGVSGVGVLFFEIVGSVKYSNYKNATNESTATDLHNTVKQYNSLQKISISVLSTCVLTTAITWLWQKIY